MTRRTVWVLAAIALVASIIVLTDSAVNGATRPVLRVCSANVQHTPDMPDWKVRQDAAEARAHCDLVLWSEIREQADHRAIQGKGWRSTPYGAGGVPVSWRTSKVAKDSAARIIRVSRPTPRCANGPSYNPSRYIGMVRLKARATGQRFTAVSLHYPQRRTKCHQSTTTSRWHDAFRNTQRALPAGALVAGGDWNRREPEIRDQVAGQHWVSPSPKALDHTYIARTGWQVASRFTRDLHSDHRLSGVRLRLR